MQRSRGLSSLCILSWANISFDTVTLMVVLTVLNAFDLAFTQSQLPRGSFAEANRLASMVGQCNALGMLIYKSVLFSVGAALLYRLRGHWQCRAGLWLLTGFYAALMVWWFAYLDAVEICLGDPAVMQSVVPY